MNSLLMIEYVKFVADYMMCSLGYKKIYNVDNPFDFMNLISLQGKTNFFEKTVSEYAKSGSGVDQEKQVVKFDEDF